MGSHAPLKTLARLALMFRGATWGGRVGTLIAAALALVADTGAGRRHGSSRGRLLPSAAIG